MNLITSEFQASSLCLTTSSPSPRVNKPVNRGYVAVAQVVIQNGRTACHKERRQVTKEWVARELVIPASRSISVRCVAKT